MGLFKLKVVIIPLNYSSIPYGDIPFGSLRKFLHLADSESSLDQVCQDLSDRFGRLYDDTDKLEIIGLQDVEGCDLDTEYIIGDVFTSGDEIRVIVNNDFQLLNINRTINRSFNITNERTPLSIKPFNLIQQQQSTPLLSSAPVLSDELNLPLSSRKRTQEYFEKGDRHIPIKSYKRDNIMSHTLDFDEVMKTSGPGGVGIERKSHEYEAVNNKGNESLKEVLEDSNVSLPPPEEDASKLIPQKNNAFSGPNERALPENKRITSGMLSMPLHSQLEHDRIQNFNTERKNEFTSTIGDYSSSSELEAELADQNDIDNSYPADPSRVSGDRDSRNKEEITLTKEEIIHLFRNRMKIPVKLREKLSGGHQKVASALLKNLEIDMNVGNPIISPNEKRSTRLSSKKLKNYGSVQGQDELREKVSTKEKRSAEYKNNSTSDKAEIQTEVSDSHDSPQRNAEPVSSVAYNDEESNYEGTGSKFKMNYKDISDLKQLNILHDKLKDFDTSLQKLTEKHQDTKEKLQNSENMSRHSNSKSDDKSIEQDTEQFASHRNYSSGVASSFNNESENNSKVTNNANDQTFNKKSGYESSSSGSESEDAEDEELEEDDLDVFHRLQNSSTLKGIRDREITREYSPLSKTLAMTGKPRLAGDVNTKTSKPVKAKKELSDGLSQRNGSISTSQVNSDGPSNKSNDLDNHPLKDNSNSLKQVENQYKKEGPINNVESQSSEIKKRPALTSLSDLALRGVPDVEPLQKLKANTSTFNKTLNNESSESSEGNDSNDSDSDETSSGSSSADDSESESDEKSSKFISMKKIKKKRSKDSGFSALMRDAKKL